MAAPQLLPRPLKLFAAYFAQNSPKLSPLLPKTTDIFTAYSEEEEKSKQLQT